MARKTKRAVLRPTVEPSVVDEVDGVQVGEEPVPGMRLRSICRGHQGTIGRIAWSPCGRFIASPSTDKTIRIWDASDGSG
jgi:WD40 repeat protein